QLPGKACQSQASGVCSRGFQDSLSRIRKPGGAGASRGVLLPVKRFRGIRIRIRRQKRCHNGSRSSLTRLEVSFCKQLVVSHYGRVARYLQKARECTGRKNPFAGPERPAEDFAAKAAVYLLIERSHSIKLQHNGPIQA